MKIAGIPFHKTLLTTTFCAATVLSASGAQVLMVNFSSTGTNDMIAADATALVLLGRRH